MFKRKLMAFIAVTITTMFILTTGCSSKDIDITDVGSIVVDYADLKNEFRDTKIAWAKNKGKYSEETQKAVDTGIASINIFYDTASNIRDKRKILSIDEVYFDAVLAVKNIKNAIIADPAASPENKQKAKDVYEQVVEMNSNINILYDKIIGVRDKEKYANILKLVVTALKLTR